ncbi:MAG: GNAT family N-acetyltransferase [Thermoplasmata archaeon]
MTSAPSLREGIDRAWLEGAASADPVRHAYALWDVEHEPDRVRFVSWATEDETRAYLLVWYADPTVTVVHWWGPSAVAEHLLPGLPPRPLVAVVPEELGPAVERLRGPSRSYPVLRLARDAISAPAGKLDPRVERIGGERAAGFRAWAASGAERWLVAYRGFDPARDFVWALTDGGRILGVASAAARLPRIWVLNGVYVGPEARGQGVGSSLTGWGIEAARRAGARVALYVREDNASARRVYERFGFRQLDRLLWMDLGADRSP